MNCIINKEHYDKRTLNTTQLILGINDYRIVDFIFKISDSTLNIRLQPLSIVHRCIFRYLLSPPYPSTFIITIIPACIKKTNISRIFINL